MIRHFFSRPFNILLILQINKVPLLLFKMRFFPPRLFIGRDKDKKGKHFDCFLFSSFFFCGWVWGRELHISDENFYAIEGEIQFAVTSLGLRFTPRQLVHCSRNIQNRPGRLHSVYFSGFWLGVQYLYYEQDLLFSSYTYLSICRRAFKQFIFKGSLDLNYQYIKCFIFKFKSNSLSFCISKT